METIVGLVLHSKNNLDRMAMNTVDSPTKRIPFENKTNEKITKKLQHGARDHGLEATSCTFPSPPP